MGLDEDIATLERKVLQLKTEYEQYFSGLQKLAPEKLRAEVEKLIRLYTGQRITNTALNFKLNAAVGKFNSFRSYWDRTIREIEEGRYVRDKFKMKLHEADRRQPAPSVPASAPRPAAAAPPSEDDHIKKVYDEYVKARKSTNEAVPKFEAVADLIKKQAPAIKEKFKASSVDFKVVVEDGKAKLKAVPKK